jgi:hypothetical protein
LALFIDPEASEPRSERIDPMTTTNTNPGALVLAAMESESDFASHAYVFPRHDGEAYLADLRALIAERDETVFEATALRITEATLRARCERLEAALRECATVAESAGGHGIIPSRVLGITRAALAAAEGGKS